MHVPPTEYDPVTYEPLGEMVPVSAVGTVVSWTWQPDPLRGPAPGSAVRLGADQAGRRRHPADARGRCGSAGRDQNRYPSARALGRRDGGRHHRHRVFALGEEPETEPAPATTRNRSP